MRLGAEYRIGTKLLKGEMTYEITGIVKKDNVIEAYILKSENDRCKVSAEAIKGYTKTK